MKKLLLISLIIAFTLVSNAQNHQKQLAEKIITECSGTIARGHRSVVYDGKSHVYHFLIVKIPCHFDDDTIKAFVSSVIIRYQDKVEVLMPWIMESEDSTYTRASVYLFEERNKIISTILKVNGNELQIAVATGKCSLSFFWWEP